MISAIRAATIILPTPREGGASGAGIACGGGAGGC
jgi:hypothetical protein